MNLNGKLFNWRKYELYYGNQNTKFSVRPSEEDLWVVKWPDGIESADWYNLTRAKENAYRMARAYYETKEMGPEGPEKPAGTEI